MNRDDVGPIPRRRSVFKKQAADVEVRQAVGKVATADLKQIRPSCDDGGQLAETLDKSFGRGLQFGDIGIVRNSEKSLCYWSPTKPDKAQGHLTEPGRPNKKHDQIFSTIRPKIKKIIIIYQIYANLVNFEVYLKVPVS